MSKRKVTFGPTTIFYFPNTKDDQEVRKCYWMICALDRIRFRDRIKQFEKIFRKK